MITHCPMTCQWRQYSPKRVEDDWLKHENPFWKIYWQYCSRLDVLKSSLLGSFQTTVFISQINDEIVICLEILIHWQVCNPGPCITNVIATCRKNFSQWERSFLWKLRCHWLKFLRRVAKTLVIQGPELLSCAVSVHGPLLMIFTISIN